MSAGRLRPAKRPRRLPIGRYGHQGIGRNRHMSLINDALKRATSRQPTTIAIDPEPAAPMQPVEYRRRGLPWYFFPALFAIMAAACWFIVKGVAARKESSSPVPKPITVQAREITAGTDIPAPAPPGAPGAEASTATSTKAASATPTVPNNSTPSEATPTATDATAPAPTPTP